MGWRTVWAAGSTAGGARPRERGAVAGTGAGAGEPGTGRAPTENAPRKRPAANTPAAHTLRAVARASRGPTLLLAACVGVCGGGGGRRADLHLLEDHEADRVVGHHLPAPPAQSASRRPGMHTPKQGDATLRVLADMPW